jgi:hypothetical protein
VAKLDIEMGEIWVERWVAKLYRERGGQFGYRDGWQSWIERWVANLGREIGGQVG